MSVVYRSLDLPHGCAVYTDSQIAEFVDIFWRYPSTRFIARVLDPCRVYEMFLREEYWNSIPSLREMRLTLKIESYTICVFKIRELGALHEMECKISSRDVEYVLSIKVGIMDYCGSFIVGVDTQVCRVDPEDMSWFMLLEHWEDERRRWRGYSKFGWNGCGLWCNVDPLSFIQVSHRRDVKELKYIESACIDNFVKMCERMRGMSIYHLDVYLFACAMSLEIDWDLGFLNVNMSLNKIMSRYTDEEYEKERVGILEKMTEYERDTGDNRSRVYNAILESIRGWC